MTGSAELRTDRPLIEACDLHKSYGENRVLRGVDVSVQRGEVTCIIGPSGSGKSTLLRTINHLEPLDSGRIYLDGELIGYRPRGGKLHSLSDRELSRQRAQVGMVFQSFNLFPHLTVMQNILEAPVGVLRRKSPEVREEAMALLARVELTHKVDAYPRQLSGGQQQRVAIARALAMKPKVMLFDEPTSALDPELVGEVLDSMRDLAKAGLTMLVVTHEIGFAREIADTLIFMDGGIIVESGKPAEVISNPSHDRTRSFLAKVL